MAAGDSVWPGSWRRLPGWWSMLDREPDGGWRQVKQQGRRAGVFAAANDGGEVAFEQRGVGEAGVGAG